MKEQIKNYLLTNLDKIEVNGECHYIDSASVSTNQVLKNSVFVTFMIEDADLYEAIERFKYSTSIPLPDGTFN